MANQERRPTRRERRALERAKTKSVKDISFSDSRRRLLVYGGALATTVALTLAGATYFLADTPKNAIQHPMAAQLKDYDAQIASRPDLLARLAPEIGELAIQHLLEQLTIPRNHFPGSFHFEWEEEYVRLHNSETSCINDFVPHNEIARSNPLNHESHFNLTKFLYQQGALNKAAASKLFVFGLHEGLHNIAPLVEQNPPINYTDATTNQQVSVTKGRGFLLLSPRPDLRKNGKTCYLNGNVALEESTVEDATQRFCRTIGLTFISAPEYARFVETYRSGILLPYFDGDFKSVLRLHNRSDSLGLFNHIGQRLVTSSPEYKSLTPKDAGALYITNLAWY